MRGRIAGVMVLHAALSMTLTVGARGDDRPSFEPEDVQRILSHGPWPMPWAPDSSNRVSAKPAAIALGRKLFFDARLSRFGALSCAFCHKPSKAWGDGRVQASSVAGLDRNTLPLYNVRHFQWFGWDGASDSLWMQSLRPLTDLRELAASPEHVRDVLRNDARLAAAYLGSFGTQVARQPPETVLVNVAKALAAFQETIVTARTPFDAYRDALARHDRKGTDHYPASAERGLKIFIGRGACSSCHSGPLFTNGAFHDVGVAGAARAGAVDPGRQAGVGRLRDSRYNRIGPFSDAKSDAASLTTRQALSRAGEAGEAGAFKVPSLRNVALTAPYMHNGSMATLGDVLRHYSQLEWVRLAAGGNGSSRGRLELTGEEVADLAAFLETLTDPRAPHAARAQR